MHRPGIRYCCTRTRACRAPHCGTVHARICLSATTRRTDQEEEAQNSIINPTPTPQLVSWLLALLKNMDGRERLERPAAAASVCCALPRLVQSACLISCGGGRVAARWQTERYVFLVSCRCILPQLSCFAAIRLRHRPGQKKKKKKLGGRWLMLLPMLLSFDDGSTEKGEHQWSSGS